MFIITVQQLYACIIIDNIYWNPQTNKNKNKTEQNKCYWDWVLLIAWRRTGFFEGFCLSPSHTHKMLLSLSLHIYVCMYVYDIFLEKRQRMQCVCVSDLGVFFSHSSWLYVHNFVIKCLLLVYQHNSTQLNGPYSYYMRPVLVTCYLSLS